MRKLIICLVLVVSLFSTQLKVFSQCVLNPPTVTASPDTICIGGSSNLSAVSAGNYINWWIDSIGGTFLGFTQSGNSFIVAPTISTTYFAEATNVLTFMYSGATQSWVVPAGITSINVDASGAQGGGSSGGLGGRVQTILSVTSGQLLYINVGGSGSSGGWNGGVGYSGSVGGGASDIRINGTGLTNRIIIAGGGGAGATCGFMGVNAGGIGGGLTGGTGAGNAGLFGGGGSQSGGGFAGMGQQSSSGINGQPGVLGDGGTGSAMGGGGGGGGFYGGGGGANYNLVGTIGSSCSGGGGGGSSYTGSGTSGTIHTQGYKTGNGQILITWGTVCTNSARVSVIVTLNSNNVSYAATSATESNPACYGSVMGLTVIGGTLGAGANWNWYSGSCGGTYIVSGVSPIINNTISTVYYVRAEGICNTTTCVTTSIINNLPSPTLVTATPSSFCSGSSSNITATSVNTVYWWSSSTGGAILGTGTNFTVSPTVSTTYYAEANLSTMLIFSYTGAAQTWTVPAGINSVNIDASGAQGNSIYNIGGLGGRVQTQLAVTPGQVLNIYVGGTPGNVYLSIGPGGWNGGANSGYVGGGGGGGATDIRIGGVNLSNRKIVAGGGGGCSYSSGVASGVGGGLIGGSGGTGAAGGIGGSQSAGGAGGTGTNNGSAGVIGVGGVGASYAGGGGGGYYGGGGGGNSYFWYVTTGGAGGGGSSYTGTGTSNTTHTQGYRSGNGEVKISWGTSVCISSNRISVTVTVNTQSTSATSASATPSIISSSSPFVLNISGGTLGGGATWNWYSGSCGGTTPIALGTTTTQTSTATNIYYVRAEGPCNTTTCVSVTVTLCTQSTEASSAAGNPAITCSSSTTLGITGGSLGVGANWNWYTGSCGGTYIKSGLNFNQYITVTSTYYVRAEGICNTTNCVSTIVIRNTTSSAAYIILASPSAICSGSSTVLTFTNGSLGTPGNWYWYDGSCGGNFIGTGDTLTHSPTITTVYYVRAEGYCNTTTCVSKTVTENTLSVATSASAIPANVCNGSSTVLTATGNSTGAFGNWYWYSGTCGGTLNSTGVSVTLSPTITTVYYVRAEGMCNTTTCISITVISGSPIVNSILANPPSLCTTGNSNLSAVSPGNQIRWWDSSIGGTSLGFTESGNNLTVSPTTTTVYYAEAITSAMTVFNYTGAAQTWTVPSGITMIKVDVKGAQGYHYSSSPIYGNWGFGGRVEARLNVTPGQLIYVYVGGKGSVSAGGWNGGGNPTGYFGLLYGGGGGGASDIRIGGQNLSNRKVVAGGGGAGSDVNPSGTNGGVGGGLIGGVACTNTSTCGGGGTQTAGGAGATQGGAGTGTLGIGGNGGSTGNSSSGSYGGAGGGGYYGGGGGYQNGGGGGSSWVTTVGSSGITHTQGYNIGHGQIIIKWNGCVSSSRVSVTVNVGTPSNPTNATATPTIITNYGGSSDLTATSPGNTISWWNSATGGTSYGNSLTGANFTVSPTVTTTYYAEANASTVTLFNYTGAVQTWTVPTGVHFVNVDAYGAEGGSSTSYGSGGLGGRVQTQLTVTPGQILNLYVGGMGNNSGTWGLGGGGWNGGGDGMSGASGGGGASDVRIGGTDLTNRVIVVGGGGGRGWGFSPPISYGGDGGGLTGSNGTLSGNYVTTSCGVGGTQIAGGAGASSYGISGTIGIGGNGGNNTFGGGGGGGYFGGGSGGGNSTSGGGGGGSSWASSILTTNTIHTQGYNIGNGSIILYWNGCASTNRISVTVTVNITSTPSTAASSASAIPATLCTGSSSTLGLIGGSLETGANWYWYSGSCGGAYLISGATPTLSPTVTTTYWVRAEGASNTTACVSITVVVSTSSIPATSATASPSNISSGASSVLSLTGGNLGGGANWYWYSASCGGTSIGTGVSTTQSPTIATTYYVRAEGSCNTTTCFSTEVTVGSCTPSVLPTSTTASSLTICSGSSSTLGFTGGNLGTDGTWYWYSGSCGGTSMGSGLSLIVSPSLMFTTYYVRAEGQCNTTNCLSITITTNTISVTANAINATSSYSNGTNDTLTKVSGILGSNSNWYWYSGSCGGTFLGYGDTLIINQTANTFYFVRAEGLCNTTSCAGILITTSPAIGNNISGIFTYSNTANTPLDSLWVSLVQNGSKIDSVQTDLNGYYQFNTVSNGTYNIIATTHKAWGGVNITDVVKVKRHFSGAELLSTSYKLHSADVNQSNFINISDAVKIARRYAGADTSFTRGDWVFEKTYGGDTINVSTYMNDTVIVNGANVSQNFKGICVGDVNGSYSGIPLGQKSLMIKGRTMKFEARRKK